MYKINLKLVLDLYKLPICYTNTKKLRNIYFILSSVQNKTLTKGKQKQLRCIVADALTCTIVRGTISSLTT